MAVSVCSALLRGGVLSSHPRAQQQRVSRMRWGLPCTRSEQAQKKPRAPPQSPWAAGESQSYFAWDPERDAPLARRWLRFLSTGATCWCQGNKTRRFNSTRLHRVATSQFASCRPGFKGHLGVYISRELKKPPPPPMKAAAGSPILPFLMAGRGGAW
ncbi:hypothetical protein KIL84_021584 [Mauremys mutica]|uniref:Uncharacterized protein n=1 Tax=Mauremys mutica TaxID=74926 RepID=A0A9D4B029_9SAUR|nr:hypothetical protein KIL84_021584 [Mauremys mutica]